MPHIQEKFSLATFEDTGSLLGLVNQRLSKICLSLFNKLENIFGLKIGLEVPPVLGMNPELWKGHLVLEKMKGINLIELWQGFHSSNIFPDEPPLHMYYVQNKFEDTPKATNVNAIGRSLVTKEEALWRSIGEAIERRCFVTFAPEKFIDSTPALVGSSGINLSSLAGISPELRKKYSHLQFSEKSTFRYVEGISLTQQKKEWIPLQLISLGRQDTLYEPQLRSLVTTGAATHQTREEALVSGILELIERDAFVITWLNALSPDYLQIDIDEPLLQELLKSIQRYQLELHVLLLPTDFTGVNVVLSLIFDRTGIGPAVCVGAKAGFNLQEAVRDSITEALGTRIYVRLNYNNARNESRDLSFQERSQIGLRARTLYWCDVEKLPRLNFLLQGKKIKLSIVKDTATQISSKEQLNFLVKAFADKNMELAYVDILSPSISKELGLYTVMTVAPELQPLWLNENFPHTWGKRLHSVPLQCGFTPRKEPFDEIHPFP